MGNLKEGSQRIPPAVSFRFEQLLASICDKANIDYEERPFATLEWRIHLEGLWRSAERAATDDDAATDVAIARFGDVSQIIRMRLGGWKDVIWRLCFSRMYRTARLISIVLTAQLVEFLRHSSSFTHIGDKVSYLVYGSNIFEGALIGCSVLIGASRGNPVFLRVCFSLLALLFQTLMIRRHFDSLGFIKAMWQGTAFDWSVALYFVLMCPLLVLSTVCLVSECFGWPDRARAKRATSR